MSNGLSKKEREKYFIEVLKSLYADFPQGEIIAHETQERPDAVIVSPLGKTVLNWPAHGTSRSYKTLVDKGAKAGVPRRSFSHASLDGLPP